jgi:hypothetical protein
MSILEDGVVDLLFANEDEARELMSWETGESQAGAYTRPHLSST